MWKRLRGLRASATVAALVATTLASTLAPPTVLAADCSAGLAFTVVPVLEAVKWMERHEWFGELA